jgi:hypothetical protein
MHKLTKWVLRTWITIASAIAFAAGWFALAQAEQPAQSAQTEQTQQTEQTVSTTAVVLSPVPSLDDLSTGNTEPGFTIVQAAPQLRTGGS